MLNRRSLGFVFLRKKITFTLVMGLMVQTISGMVVFNTTMLSLLHVGVNVNEQAAQAVACP